MQLQPHGEVEGVTLHLSPALLGVRHPVEDVEATHVERQLHVSARKYVQQERFKVRSFAVRLPVCRTGQNICLQFFQQDCSFEHQLDFSGKLYATL